MNSIDAVYEPTGHAVNEAGRRDPLIETRLWRGCVRAVVTCEGRSRSRERLICVNRSRTRPIRLHGSEQGQPICGPRPPRRSKRTTCDLRHDDESVRGLPAVHAGHHGVRGGDAADEPLPRPEARTDGEQARAFECGATPIDTRNVKALPIKYYAVAIVFILFDLETVFLFIWALGAQPLTTFMLATFGIFMLLLILILLYVYKARLLEGVTE